MIRGWLLKAAGAGDLLARVAEAEQLANEWRAMSVQLAARNMTLRRQVAAANDSRTGW